MDTVKEYRIVATDKSDPLYMTPEDVERFSIELNSVILHRCIMQHMVGSVTWEQAMQIAAVELAKQNSKLLSEIQSILTNQRPRP